VLTRVVGQIGELVGEIFVVVVDDPVALAGRPGHVYDEVGPHRRPEHHPPPLGRVRLTWLAVIGDDRRVVAVEPQPDDPGERGIDNPKSHSLPGFDRDGTWNAPVDRDRVADAARHAGFHGIAETAGDPSL